MPNSVPRSPSPFPNQVQIANDAVTRVPSAGTGAYARFEKQDLSRWDTQKELGADEVEEVDERDVRKKQVR